jgi:uncharacterized protein YjbJ (UPF0337 family)
MSESTHDRAEGMADEVKGTAKEGWGKVTGNEKTEAEGQLDQAKGKAKQGLADAKDAVDDAVDSLTD